MNRLARCLTTLVLLATPSAAIGQEPAPPGAVGPRVQVGVDGGTAMLLVYPVAGVITTRATVAINPTWGVEGLFDFLPGLSHDGVTALYRVQARWRLGRASPDRKRREVFLTFGGTGAFRHSSWSGYRWTDQAGRTHVEPGGSHTDFLPPYIPTVGVSVQKVLASHLALRGDLTCIGLVVIQPTLGVSIPIGHYSRAAR